MATPNAPTNMSILSTGRKFFEASRSPATALLAHAGRAVAIIVTDSTAPSVPQNLAATAVGTSQINLTWSASTDTGGSSLQGYRIYRNGSSTPLNSTGSTSYSDTGLTAGIQYTYRVSAYDGQGNESAQSTQAQATTTSASGFTNQRTGTSFGTLAAAIAGSISGDTILVGAGPFSINGDQDIALNTLTIQRASSSTQPVLNFTNVVKGAFHRTAGGAGALTLDGLDIRGPGANDNEASQWEESHTGVYTLTVRNCTIRDFGNGIIVGNKNSDIVVIDRVEIFDCGGGPAANNGSTHNAYVGEVASLTVRGLYTHDCTDGHLLKTRALTNDIQASFFDSGTESNSRELELPCGGTNIVRGNIIVQRANSGNGDIVGNANENISINCAAPGRGQTFNFQQNTVVNYRSAPTFFVLSGALFTPTNDRTDNIFAGSGAPTVTGNSTFATDASFVNAAANDFRLSTPVAGAQNWATVEYVHPADYRTRTDSFRGAIAASAVSLPTWLTSALGSTPTLNQAIAIGTDTLAAKSSSLFEGVDGIIGVYGPPLCVRASDSLVLLMGGGHGDSNNNIVVGLPLEQNAPQFYEAGTRTPSGQRVANAQYNSDGRPSSFHSYHHNVFNDQLNRFMTVARSFVSGQNPNNGCWGDLSGLNPDTHAWDPTSPPTYVKVPGTFGGQSDNAEAPACIDPSTGNIFSFNSSGLHQWVRSGSNGTWITRNTGGGVNYYGASMTYDTLRRRLLRIGGNGYSQAPVYALESENYSTWHVMTVTGAPSSMNSEVWSVCYDPVVDCLWLTDNYMSRAAYRKMTFASSAPTANATISAAGVFSGVTFASGANQLSLWGSIRYVPNLKGVVMLAGSGGGLYFVRTAP